MSGLCLELFRWAIMGSRLDKSQSNGKNCIDIAQRRLEQTAITSAVLFHLYLAVNSRLITRANFKMNELALLIVFTRTAPIETLLLIKNDGIINFYIMSVFQFILT